MTQALPKVRQDNGTLDDLIVNWVTNGKAQKRVYNILVHHFATSTWREMGNWCLGTQRRRPQEPLSPLLALKGFGDASLRIVKQEVRSRSVQRPHV